MLRLSWQKNYSGFTSKNVYLVKIIDVKLLVAV